MKYTKEYCREHRIVLHVGNNNDLVDKLRALHNVQYYYGTGGYEEEHCINLGDGCYCSRDFYKKEGYTVLTPEEFFKVEAYEIY